MITREQVKSILYILDNEYPGIFTGDDTRDTLKINTWFAKLKNFSYEQCQQAVSQLLDSKVYGRPNISDLMEILKPTFKEQNEGAEFAQRLIDLCARLGTDYMGDKIKEEYGDVGFSVYMQVKSELRELKTDDNNTFKAQVRNIFNSYREREKYGQLESLPYSDNLKRIDDEINKSIKRLD